MVKIWIILLFKTLSFLFNNNDNILQEINECLKINIANECLMKYPYIIESDSINNINDIYNWFNNYCTHKSNIILYFNTLVMLPLVKYFKNKYICILVIHENEIKSYIREIWNNNETNFINELNNCECVIFVSEKNKNDYSKYFTKHIGKVIYNGIEYNSNVVKKNNEKLKICLIGTLCKKKIKNVTLQ